MGMFLRRGTAQRGMLASELEVGQTIKLNVNGKAWEWLVVNQGLPSDIYDASCNGTWLLMKDIYEKRVWQSGKNKYESSGIHTYLNNTFLNLFESNIKDAIKQVKLPYRKNGGSGGTTQQGANGLPCKIFLLSAPEVHYEHSYIDSGEGAALSYFASCVTNNADPKRVAYYNGSANYWWLRSPFTNDNIMTMLYIQILRRVALRGSRSTDHTMVHPEKQQEFLFIRPEHMTSTKRVNGQCRMANSLKLTRTQHIV